MAGLLRVWRSWKSEGRAGKRGEHCGGGGQALMDRAHAPDVASRRGVGQVSDGDPGVRLGQVQRWQQGDGESGRDEGLGHRDIVGRILELGFKATVVAAELLQEEGRSAAEGRATPARLG